MLLFLQMAVSSLYYSCLPQHARSETISVTESERYTNRRSPLTFLNVKYFFILLYVLLWFYSGVIFEKWLTASLQPFFSRKLLTKLFAVLSINLKGEFKINTTCSYCYVEIMIFIYNKCDSDIRTITCKSSQFSLIFNLAHVG